MIETSISVESPLSDDGRRLIAESEAALREVYPPEECFSFSPEELAGPETRFFVARNGGKAVGCVALVNMGDYGEVKRMFVNRSSRGLGIGRSLMCHLEAEAREAGLPAVRLETGHELASAMAIYSERGYLPCPAFGGYPDIPSNLFMEKLL